MPILSAHVDPNGTPYIYSQAVATDLGDLPGPSFIQQNLLLTAPAGAPQYFRVYSRPDVVGARQEVWFELGDVGDLDGIIAGTATPPTPADLGPYTYQIFDNSTVPPTALTPIISVPIHYWNTRHRWQSAPRAIVNTPAQLIAQKLVGPYGLRDIAGGAYPVLPTDGRFDYTGPMSLAGITPDMGETGERFDIGVYHEIDADYLIRQTPDAEANMRSWAEAANSIQFHWRDRKTGGPVNNLTYPNFNIYSGGANGQPCIPILPSANPVGMDAAHMPALGYVRFMATGDPSDLENLQFQVLENLSETTYWHGTTGPDNTQIDVINPEQVRDTAWSLNHLVKAIKATQTAEGWAKAQGGAWPSTLIPSADMKTILDYWVGWFEQNWVNNPSVGSSRFQAGPQVGQLAPWQEKYFLGALCEGVYLGFTELEPIRLWKKAQAVGMAVTMPAFPTPYYFPLGGPQGIIPFNPDSDYEPDWLTAYNAFFQADIAAYGTIAAGGQIDPSGYALLQKDPANGGVIVQTNTEYVNQHHGSLSYCANLGDTDVLVPFSLMHLMLQMNANLQSQQQDKAVLIATARWSFLTSLDGSVVIPSPVLPSSPITQPPTGVSMANTLAQIAAGTDDEATLAQAILALQAAPPGSGVAGPVGPAGPQGSPGPTGELTPAQFFDALKAAIAAVPTQ